MVEIRRNGVLLLRMEVDSLAGQALCGEDLRGAVLRDTFLCEAGGL